MTIIAYIATFLFFILPFFFIFAMIKPNKFRKLFKQGKVTRFKILRTTLLTALILFVIIGFTIPPESESSKLAKKAEAAKTTEINDIKKQKENEVKKITEATNEKKATDEQNSRLASTIDLHNSKIKTENDNKTIYNIVPNSYSYDTQIELLDENKKVVNSTKLNHANHNWVIIANKKPEYDKGVVKYLTYSVSVGGKYYNSNKVLDISKDYVNYPKLASTIDLHNSNIRVEALDKVAYGIIPNSYKYDVQIKLLDMNKRTIANTDINHTKRNWSIVTDNRPVYDSGAVKYLTYEVSIDNRYYNSGKIIPISNDYKNYPALANSITINNAKITKKDGKITYNINPSSKIYDARLEFVGIDDKIILSKLLNHADKTWDIVSTESPVSSGGQIKTIKTYISIDSKYFISSQQIDVAGVNYIDQDLIDETARQAKIAEQAEADRQVAASKAAAQQTQQESQASQSVYYKNCDAVRAAGAAPIYEGQPGYRSKLDRNLNGIACE